MEIWGLWELMTILHQHALSRLMFIILWGKQNSKASTLQPQGICSLAAGEIPTRGENDIHMNTYTCKFTMLGFLYQKNVFFIHSTCEGTMFSYPRWLICGWGTVMRCQVSLEPNPFPPITSHWLWWGKPATETMSQGRRQSNEKKMWKALFVRKFQEEVRLQWDGRCGIFFIWKKKNRG